MRPTPAALALALALAAPAGADAPDLSNIMRVLGYFPVAQACPVSTDRALTANHVPRLPFDRLFQLNPWPLRWDQGEDVEGATLVPLRDYLRDDLMVMEVLPKTDKFYPIAARAPKVGEELWWRGYEWRNRRELFADRTYHGRLLRIVAGVLIVDEKSAPGASGSCVLNSAGEVVAIVAFSRSVDESDGREQVSGLVGIWGRWLGDLLKDKKPEGAP